MIFSEIIRRADSSMSENSLGDFLKIFIVFEYGGVRGNKRQSAQVFLSEYLTV